jgi:hypothetical protein
MFIRRLLLVGTLASCLCMPAATLAQDEAPSTGESEITLQAEITAVTETRTDKAVAFDAQNSNIPPTAQVEEIVWDFGDGVRTTGEKVSHTYTKPGSYKVLLTLRTTEGQSEDTIGMQVFDRVVVLLADASVPAEQLALYHQQAQEMGLLLVTVKTESNSPGALIEEELTQQLINATDEVAEATHLITWTAGSISANVLSKFAQHTKSLDPTAAKNLNLENKVVALLTDTSFTLLTPAAQSTFDQLRPAYIILTRPSALPLLLSAKTPEETREKILNSPLEYQLLGTFSERASRSLGFTNFMSFGINFLVNRGVPINNIILILMIPVIATILSFTRQVIGIKALGLITPAMTTLCFLVLGLSAGLIVFLVVLLSGTLTRILLRRLHLLYLPRMALVLTMASLAILVMLGFGVATGRATTLSFSIFPIFILTILAEEFIAIQFSRGARTALSITAWTLLLSILCFYLVSWELLRTLLLSYPEIILLAIPINIALGRFSGLRLVEYFRFRELLRYGTTGE